MTRDEYLLALQRLIATEKGYTDLSICAGRTLKGAAFNSGLVGTLHPDEGPTLVPRWPWDWCEAGKLVEEMEAAPEMCGVSIQCYKVPVSPYTDEVLPSAVARATRWADIRGGSGINYPFDGEGCTKPEAISRCWLAWKGVDLSDLPPVAP